MVFGDLDRNCRRRRTGRSARRSHGPVPATGRIRRTGWLHGIEKRFGGMDLCSAVETFGGILIHARSLAARLCAIPRVPFTSSVIA